MDISRFIFRCFFFSFYLVSISLGYAQELKKHPVIFSLQSSISPFESVSLLRSSTLGVGLFKISKAFIGLNVASFSALATIGFTQSYSDPRINTHYFIPPPPIIYYSRANIFFKTPSIGICFFKLKEYKKVNTMLYVSLNIMHVRRAYMQWNDKDYSTIHLPPCIFCEVDFNVVSKPSFDLLIKYTLYAKKEKRKHFTVSPFVRYAYLSMSGIEYATNYKQLYSFEKLNNYTKHLFTTGVSLDFLFLRNKMKLKS